MVTCTPYYNLCRIIPIREEGSPSTFIFGAQTSLLALQAVPLPGAPVILVVETEGHLTMYSGTIKVSAHYIRCHV